MKTKDARSLPPAAQEALRIRAVLAVKGGLKHVAVARLFGVARQTVDAWVRRYRKRGMRSLRAIRRGRPLGTQLTAQQGQRLKQLIVGRYPEQLRLRCCLWTRDAVQELIRRRHGLKLSVWTVGRYLQAWGFTPQKPRRRAYEQNSEAVQHWLATDYPAIQRQAKREKAEIHWLDQMGMRSDHQTGRSYGLKGHTPVIPGTGKRFRCNLISAVTNRGTLRFMIYRRKFQAPVMIDFLRRLVRDRARPIYVIADRHPVHRSAAVRAWLRKQAGRIRFYHLPSYSPELNPDEMLNNDVKSNALGRQRPKDERAMIRGVRSHLRKRQRHPEVVRRYFHEESVRYAAAGR